MANTKIGHMEWIWKYSSIMSQHPNRHFPFAKNVDMDFVFKSVQANIILMHLFLVNK